MGAGGRSGRGAEHGPQLKDPPVDWHQEGAELQARTEEEGGISGEDVYKLEVRNQERN